MTPEFTPFVPGLGPGIHEKTRKTVGTLVDGRTESGHERHKE
jgi:hypothetical protein